ncbi:serine-rich adhesin for platelets isoform X2 [Drosophila gunungcola]|uniref:serine-rich adhesin for platelets isoform X2 n=1 Tax=Drosophila gunungcola TaxID=103775 RepID=UPI0022E5B6E2|nr:serine-rich adhesin for platelets isoform X2 [Drosophila gunungcola]
MPTTKTTTTCSEEEETAIIRENCDTPMATPTKTITTTITSTSNAAATTKTTITHREEEAVAASKTKTTILAAATGCHKPLFFSRRFQDKRNFSSLPLFVYATSPSTHAHSADGVGVAKGAAAFSQKNEGFELPATHGISKTDGSCISHHSQSNGNGIGIGINGSGSGNIVHHLGGALRTTDLASGAMECLPMSSAAHHPHLMAGATAVGAVAASPTATVVVGATYPHHLHHMHHHLSHHTPYSNSYGSHHIHSEQTKSLQELQHEVGALLEFRDLVIETFPDLKHKMASMSATPSTPTSSVGAIGGSHSVGGGSSSLATRREWEPGIRMKRKLSHKEPSTSSASAAAPSSGAEASSSSLTRSRSNSHSGKKEPKSGENNNGSVVQDSGFSTETSSSKEGHSASSTNGAMTVAIAANRLSCAESDDELLNLLDVIHRKSNRLREEVEQLQSYERQQGDGQKTCGEGKGASKDGMTPQQFREQVERLNREDIKQLRKERDRLLDKLAEMEAETLTGRIKAAKMSDQVEELVGVKKDLEEQLKLAMAQKLELSSRVQQLQQQQQQQQQQQSKSSSSASQSDYSSQRNFLSSATTVLSNGSRPNSNIIISNNNTFQPVVLDQPAQEAFHQSSGSDILLRKQAQQQSLGRLDGIVSTPGTRNSKCRLADSKRFAAILLETNVLELQRHLLTLTVQNQVLAQKLDSSSKSKTLLAKRLDKSSEEFEHLRYQLEEKSIELEGTKAQLRLVESRLQANNSSTNSYLLSSQHDYETNRSSASTTLMLSRRGVSDSVDSASTAMPAPPVTQISTPSMKAMVPLAMDELQQHSSSTESAHEQEHDNLNQNQNQAMPRTPNSTVSPLSKTMINASPCPVGSSTPSNIAARVMSISVGGVSPFEGMTPPARQNAFRKFGSASKPSKIPLPGSKAAAYFSGKPPTGRPSTAGRSPPSAHNSSSTSYGSKSSLSRSTGNLQSLRRADTSASNHSLSTNTSRSSTSSSIPLATTPYSSGSTGNRSQPTAATTPSPRVLQNSPLPKLKRDTISSRVRHLDSLSRAQHSPEGVKGVSSATSIAAQLSSTLRKDLQLSGNGTGATYHQHHQNHHRRSGHSPASNSSGSGVSRRYSSASTGGSGGRAIGRDLGETTTPTSSFGGDSDSGKNLANPVEKPNFRLNNHNWQLWQTRVQVDHYLPHELHDVSEETAYDSYYTEYTTPDSMDCGSANLLVTFDYGYSDSIEARADPAGQDDGRSGGADPEYGDGCADAEGAIWFGTPPKEKKEAKLFEVHHVQHKLLDVSLQSLISYDVDDFEEELSDPGPDEEIFYDSIECV